MPKNFQNAFIAKLKNTLDDEPSSSVNVQHLGYVAIVTVGKAVITGPSKPSSTEAINAAYRKAYHQTKSMTKTDLTNYLGISDDDLPTPPQLDNVITQNEEQGIDNDERDQSPSIVHLEEVPNESNPQPGTSNNMDDCTSVDYGQLLQDELLRQTEQDDTGDHYPYDPFA